MIRPLGEKLPVSVELLTDGPDWQLVSAARNWAEENALSGLTVGCADCDAEMYRALGFETRLGTMLALNL